MAIGLFNIIKATAGTNYLTNPSMEDATTGWTAGADWTLTQSDAQQFRGVYSAKLVATASTSPIILSGTQTITATTNYIVSAWVYIPAGWASGNVNIDVSATGLSNEVKTSWVSGTDSNDAWRRVYTSFTSGAGTTLTIAFISGTNPVITDDIYIDAIQLETGTTLTDYIDGDQTGCYWLPGTPHVSARSSRFSYSKAGGEEINLRDDKSYAVAQMSGAGQHPVDNVTIPYAILGGSQYRRTTPLDGIIDLPATVYGTTRNGYHVNRKGVVELLDADATEPQQKALLRYTGTLNYVEIPVLYDSGLEITGIRGFSEDGVPLRLQRDPFWRELAQQGVVLNTVSTITVDGLATRDNDTGEWTNMGSSANTGQIFAITEAVDGTIIVGGASTISSASIYSPARWDGAAWANIPVGGTGIAGAINGIQAIHVAPNGYIWIAGDFTSVNGVAAQFVAYFNGTTWNAAGAGTASGVTASTITSDDSGNIYVGGTFSLMGGVANTTNIAKWTGSAWVSISSGVTGTSPAVLSSAKLGNTLYFGGGFLTIDGVTANYFVKYDPVLDVFSAPSASAPNDAVKGLAIGPGNNVYLVGDFATIGTVNYAQIARFDGANFHTLGEGGDGNPILDVAVTSSGEVYAAGAFTAIDGSLIVDRVAKFSNNAWQPLDINLPGTGDIEAVLVSRMDNVYLGFNDAGTAVISGAPKAVNNRATAPCFPIIIIDNTAPAATADTIVRIDNRTTRQSIFFNNLVIQPNEVITLDLRQGIKSVTSNTRGDLLRFVRRGSQKNVFRFLAGVNNVSIYINNTATVATARAYWDVFHGSVDGGAE